MIEHLDYTISRDPFSSKTLSALHWECFQAIKEETLSSFFEEKGDDLNELICIVKCLSELESLGLIKPKASQIRYDEWQSRRKLSDKVEVKSTEEVKAEEKVVPPAPAATATAPIKDSDSFSPPKPEVVPQKEKEEDPVDASEPESVDAASESMESEAFAEDLPESPQDPDSPDADESIDVKEVQRKKRGERVSLDL